MLENVAGLIAVGGAFMIPIVGAVAHYWHKTRMGEYDAHLKRTMLERGMSADEIERVLAAGKKRD